MVAPTKALTIIALLSVATPLAAQPYVAASSPAQARGEQANGQPRAVLVPGYGTVYVVPVQPKDTRTPRQRCIDEEIAREGGSPSELALGAIDLKCSQR